MIITVNTFSNIALVGFRRKLQDHYLYIKFSSEWTWGDEALTHVFNIILPIIEKHEKDQRLMDAPSSFKVTNKCAREVWQALVEADFFEVNFDYEEVKMMRSL